MKFLPDGRIYLPPDTPEANPGIHMPASINAIARFAININRLEKGRELIGDEAVTILPDEAMLMIRVLGKFRNNKSERPHAEEILLRMVDCVGYPLRSHAQLMLHAGVNADY